MLLATSSQASPTARSITSFSRTTLVRAYLFVAPEYSSGVQGPELGIYYYDHALLETIDDSDSARLCLLDTAAEHMPLVAAIHDYSETAPS